MKEQGSLVTGGFFGCREPLVSLDARGTRLLHEAEHFLRAGPRFVAIQNGIRHTRLIEQVNRRNRGGQKSLLQLAIDSLSLSFLRRIAKSKVQLDEDERLGGLADKFRFLEDLSIQILAACAPSMAGEDDQQIFAFSAGLALAFVEIANPGRPRGVFGRSLFTAL